MLDLKFIRENPDVVRWAIQVKNIILDFDKLLALDAEVRSTRHKSEQLAAQRRRLADQFRTAAPGQQQNLGEQSRQLAAELKVLGEELARLEGQLGELMLLVPNIPDKSAPVGPDAESNVVVARWGEPPQFDFPMKDHVDLAQRNNWVDLTRVTEVCGNRTYCLKNRLAQLEFVLLTMTMQRMMGEGFTLLTVPSIAREAAFVGTGHFPTGRTEVYELPEDSLFLSGTAEIVLNSLHSGEILESLEQPILYAGVSPCFRREAGSAGRDVRGLLRVHQFFKVEQYVISENNAATSRYWHDRLLKIATDIVESLELPYQVIECSTGDMGAGKVRMHDIEVWVPSLGTYRETHSCSTLHDWQARRANIRYRDTDRNVQFAHTLNNTALATPRILVPLLENNQTAEGRLRLPAVLRPYFNGDEYL